MNGIFTLADPVSRGHRQSIAGFLKSQNCISVADFGGGFGALAKEIVRQNICASAYVIEPYPSPLALALTGEVQRVKFVSDLTDAAPYDALIAQDVLEHVEDPVGLVSRLVLSVLPGGLIIFANCFYPVIQCHLPATFHLRHTFVCIMRYFGLEYLTRVPGAEHALIFRRKRKLNMNLVRRSERFSQLLGPIVNATLPMLSKIARRLRNQ
jgi:2-polyprenyl-6-hydroxyphenyl methylase/3-demethylubiquinone-9 3-methyltransferase